MTNDSNDPKAGGLYKYYALGLMVLVYVVNFIDRSILSILNQSIKDDLGVSDTAMGFLGGIAFAVFYTFVGIPIARLADTGVRRNILATCLAIWSGMTALCGLATNFGQLLAARIGVAVGEAGGSPPSHSMISDLFPPHQRATALGVYALGIPIGSMLGYLFGGWINEMFDWRTAFLAVGLPGIFLAVIVRLTLREPVRGASEPGVVEDAVAPPIRTVVHFLWGLKSFRFVAIGAGLHAFFFYGVGYWLPTMFFRTHGVGSFSMGQSLFMLGFAGIAGTFLGGYVTDKLGARDYRWYAWSPALTTILSVPFALFSFLSDDPTQALWVYAIPYFLLATYLGPTFSIIQTLVSNRMRATASSVLFLIISLIGLGLGPQFVGITSDVLATHSSAGDDALRYALIAALAANVISAALYFMAASTVRDELEMKKALAANSG